MKRYTVLLFLLAALSLRAQDTIVYRNGLKTPVHLKEISPTEIRYQRADMAGGPDYVISKSEVAKLIYKNGITETMQAAIPSSEGQPALSAGPPVISVQQDKITYRDAKRNYRSLQQLALSHPDSKRQPELSQLANDIRQHKNIQDGTRTGAVVCGGLAIGGTFLYALSYALSNNSEPAFYVPPAVLGGLAVGLGSVAIVYNIRLRDKRKDFVDLYNQ